MLRIRCDEARLHGGELPDGVDRLGQPLQAVADRDADVLTPRFFSSVRTESQKLRPRWRT